MTNLDEHYIASSDNTNLSNGSSSSSPLPSSTMEATTTTTLPATSASSSRSSSSSSSPGSGAHSAPCQTSGTWEVINDMVNKDDGSDQDEQQEQETPQPASWRMNPEESLSDWTIEIKTTTSPHDSEDDGDDDDDDADVVTTYYHVHKYVLAVGSRRSEYFARLFQQGVRFAESRKRTSRIRLQSLAAEAFPLLLDYLYTPGPPPDCIISTNSATALHSLAEYFRMPRLRSDVMQFVKSDLNMNHTCATYYEHAKSLMDETVLQTVIEFGIENIIRLTSTSRRRLIQATDARFWLAIVQNVEVAKTGVGWPQLSPIITEFCRHYQSELSGETFEQLTDSQHLPIIRVYDALELLALERVLVAPTSSRGKSETGIPPYQLSNLQERCVSSIACNWECIDFDNASTQQQLEKQHSAVLTKISALIVAAAKKKIKADRAKQEAKLKAKSKKLTKVNRSLLQQLRNRRRMPPTSPPPAVVSDDEDDDDDWPGDGGPLEEGGEFYFV